jgi:ribonuclease BN (tRNA processing enzyme)
MKHGFALRVIGSSPAMPRPGGACSSYLVRTRDTEVLFDIGPGAVGKLQLATDYAHLDAIVVSHMHPDHFFDLVPLRYGLKYGPSARTDRLPLWLPPGGCDVLANLANLVGHGAHPDFFDDVLDVREYEPSSLTIGDMHLSFCRTRHYIAAFAVRAERNGASVTYSADTAPCDAVVELARNTSVFLCEAALGLDCEEGERGHCSAYEAGEMAQRAGVRRLVLTHYSAAYGGDALVEAAKRSYGGPIEIADDGLELDVVTAS